MLGILIRRVSLLARYSSERLDNSSIFAPMSATSARILSTAAESPDFLASAIPLAASFRDFLSWSTSYLALRHSSSSLDDLVYVLVTEATPVMVGPNDVRMLPEHADI